ncbi:amidohydrolase [Kytococcus sedentarius]|uniref:amidohydrolase n=1 Tax=Kytococcus sedentarius TaxID=1276 RepID=UPI0035BC5412
MTDLLVTDVRLVPLDGEEGGGPAVRRVASASGGTAATGPVDVLVRDGVITEVGPGLTRPEEVPVLAGEGRWVVPGLWDHHVHLGQWGATTARLDLAPATSARDAVRRVAERLASDEPLPETGVLVGWGHRSAQWDEDPTVAMLDEVAREVPVVLISGDGHHGWMNTPALRLLGGPADATGVVREADWFPMYDRLGNLPGAAQEAELGVARAVTDALALGVVGITDLEMGRPWEDWRRRCDLGQPMLRARTGVYAEELQGVLDAGVRTGQVIEGTDGLVTMGPLKIISDGSLNTRTAWCREPYADAHRLTHPCGAANLTRDEMHELMTAGHAGGLEMAIHAIGDAAVGQALEAFASIGARGGIEHAQLVGEVDLERWGALPVRASVQPAHLLDDRAVTEQCWPDRTGLTFALRRFAEHGIEMAMGSDAPVSPLDPWLTLASAVHRGPVDAETWHPELALTPAEALAASVDSQRVRPGARGDLVLLDADPLGGGDSAQQARVLRSMGVSATVLAGQVVHGG